MDKLKGFLIILLCNLAGNVVADLLGLPFPGSVIGLLLLLLLLMVGWVKLSTVEPSASLLISLMLLFILPGAVNIMNILDKFSGVVWQVALITVLSTLLSLLSAAWTAERLVRLRKRIAKTGGTQ